MDNDPQIDEDECPICHMGLPLSKDGTKTAAEAHIASCIDTHMSQPGHQANDQKAYAKRAAELENTQNDEKECPVCRTSLLTKEFDGNEAARHAHIASCFERNDSSSASQPQYAPPTYERPANLRSGKLSRDMKDSKSSAASSKLNGEAKAGGSTGNGLSLQNQEDQEVGTLRKWFSALGGDSKTPMEKKQQIMAKADGLMSDRWGPPGSQRREMVARYWAATRMFDHWMFLHGQHPRQFRKYLEKGYMEPIPTAMVTARTLAYLYPEGSYYETPAEKRLYYLLNNGMMPDGSRHASIRPLNINRDRYTIIRRGNQRNARQIPLDPKLLAKYMSPGDVFQSDKQIKSHNYSEQVPNTVYDTRIKALHEFAEGIIHGTDHLETMVLIDVSGSMTWNPHSGIPGPDGITRYHDQPSNIRLVQHLVRRVMNHMLPRAQKEHPHQRGIDVVTFSSYGTYIGQLSTLNFNHDWQSKVRLGGGTQVMQGWQKVKATYFQHQNKDYGHGTFDPDFGWQATPGMPKLSLLVFLDGEATDMDEFELELLGETWAYVTIALVGMENCPHHHSHAIELERVAKFNPHVGFFDVHGRVCERLIVQDLLGSVYPVDPPVYEEICKPEYDIKPDGLPAYSTY
ncbi:hypothetical protein MMC34_007661 [Xylographa carneopallida]|nr:hypothetical protein [Xylographa carneopallida]